jgi:hypothetical protein
VVLRSGLPYGSPHSVLLTVPERRRAIADLRKETSDHGKLTVTRARFRRLSSSDDPEAA